MILHMVSFGFACFAVGFCLAERLYSKSRYMRGYSDGIMAGEYNERVRRAQ
jgi:hypothetical protein